MTATDKRIAAAGLVALATLALDSGRAVPLALPLLILHALAVVALVDGLACGVAPRRAALARTLATVAYDGLALGALWLGTAGDRRLVLICAMPFLIAVNGSSLALATCRRALA